MNLKTLVDSLSLRELNEVSILILDRKKELIRHTLKPLDDLEKGLIRDDRVLDAIRSYRNRNFCSLVEAKVAIDCYRGL